MTARTPDGARLKNAWHGLPTRVLASEAPARHGARWVLPRVDRRPSRRVTRRGLHVLICTSCAWAVSGCTLPSESLRKRELGVEVRVPEAARSASYRDTVGSITFYEGMRGMRVTGYGLVVGLGRDGATDCPKSVFDRVVRDIEKQMRSGSSLVGAYRVTPEMMIRDRDTAVVLVQGDIKPGATSGTRFDVAVSALPGTDTKSLRGGRLYPCELDYSILQSPTRMRRSGRTLALAGGPLFINPFVSEDAATPTNVLEAVVIGGGYVTEDRRVQLVLAEPSYSAALRVERTINSKYPGLDKVADAVSASFVKIRIPGEHRAEPEHFLALIRALYLPRHPGFIPKRCRELGAELVRPDAPHAAIALAFEAIGPAALPTVEPLYTHSREYVSFHAAAAGLGLEDQIAVEAMAVHARDPESPFRFQAIRALGRARIATAAPPLRRLLGDEDPRVRIAAYEELSRRRDMIVESEVIGGDNFRLERVESPRPPIIYAKRSGDRRIAILGGRLKCNPPVFYLSPGGALTINAADADASELTLVRRSAAGSASPAIPCALDALDLIRLAGNDPEHREDRITGLAMDYGSVVHMLYTLCADHVIPADFILEETNIAELFGPPQRKQRPDSEL